MSVSLTSRSSAFLHSRSDFSIENTYLGWSAVLLLGHNGTNSFTMSAIWLLHCSNLTQTLLILPFSCEITAQIIWYYSFFFFFAVFNIYNNITWSTGNCSYEVFINVLKGRLWKHIWRESVYCTCAAANTNLFTTTWGHIGISSLCEFTGTDGVCASWPYYND